MIPQSLNVPSPVYNLFTLDTNCFATAAKAELARDIMVKTRQIDLLIASLPGAGVTEQDQLQRVQRLETELELAEQERLRWLMRRKELLAKCDSIILQLTKSKNDISSA